MISITQNPRSQASHPQCRLFSLHLDLLSSPHRQRASYLQPCNSALPSLHGSWRIFPHTRPEQEVSRTTVHLTSLVPLYLFPALQLIKFLLEALQHTLQSQHSYCSCSRFSTTKLAWQDGFPTWSHWLPLSLSLSPGLSPVGTSHGLLCVRAVCESVTRDSCFPLGTGIVLLEEWRPVLITVSFTSSVVAEKRELSGCWFQLGWGRLSGSSDCAERKLYLI